MAFRIKIEPEVHQDIQEGIHHYNTQQTGLGYTFYTHIEEAFQVLKTNPFFQIRYDEVRCLPLKKYPYMIHFTVDEQNKLVVVRAVFSTLRHPEIWKKRSKYL